MKNQLKILSLLLVSNLLIEQKSIYAIEAMSEADTINNTEAFELALHNLDLKALQKVQIPDIIGFVTKSFNSMYGKLLFTDVAYSNFRGLPNEEENVSAKEFGVSLPRKEFFERAKEIMFYLISKGANVTGAVAVVLTYWFDPRYEESVIMGELRKKVGFYQGGHNGPAEVIRQERLLRENVTLPVTPEAAKEAAELEAKNKEELARLFAWQEKYDASEKELFWFWPSGSWPGDMHSWVVQNPAIVGVLHNFDLEALKKATDDLDKQNYLLMIQKSFNYMLCRLADAYASYFNFPRYDSEQIEDISEKYFGVRLSKENFSDRAKKIILYLISKGAVFLPIDAVYLQYWLDLKKDQSPEAIKVTEAAKKEAVDMEEIMRKCAAIQKRIDEEEEYLDEYRLVDADRSCKDWKNSNGATGEALYTLDLEALKKANDEFDKNSDSDIRLKCIDYIMHKLERIYPAYVNLRGADSQQEEDLSAKHFGVRLSKEKLLDRAKGIIFYLINKGISGDYIDPKKANFLQYWFDLKKDQSPEAVKVKEWAKKEAVNVERIMRVRAGILRAAEKEPGESAYSMLYKLIYIK